MLLIIKKILSVLISSALLYSISLNAIDPAISSSIWHQTTQLPYKLASHSLVSSSSNLYIINGSAEFRASKFSVLTNKPIQTGGLSVWNTNPINTPTALIWHTSAFKDPYVYILGGKEENFGSAMDHVKKVFVGKISNDEIISWTPTSELPLKLSRGSAIIFGNRIYYAGGMVEINGNIYYQNIYMAEINEADGSLSSWIDVGDLPEALSGFGMFVEGNQLIVIGGENSTSKKAKVYTATINNDGTINPWTETQPLPKALSRAQYVKSGNKLFVIGGLDSTGASLDDVYFSEIKSDGTVDTWQTSQFKIPQPTCCGTAASFGNYLYLLGGHNTGSGEYFDNVFYADISEITNSQVYETLDVPYFSQNSTPWGEKEYDHAKSLKFSATDFERWGCAVTSAAMVMRYHHINVLPNGKPIDPGSLNNWLKENKGYVSGKDHEGSYSYLNFAAISSLSQKVFKAGKSRLKLEYYREIATKDNLDSILNASKDPAILKVSNSDTDSHFVVAKGKTNNSYKINDPEWNYPDLTSFNDTFSQIDRFVPAHSNLSYITIVINPKTQILVTDSQGRKTGSYYENNQLITYTEIPNATYTYQAPISNPNSSGLKVNLGTGVNEFLLPKPSNGNYIIEVSSLNIRDFEMNISAFQENGDFEVEKVKGNTNNPEIIRIEYDTRKKAKVKRYKKCHNSHNNSENSFSYSGNGYGHNDCENDGKND